MSQEYISGSDKPYMSLEQRKHFLKILEDWKTQLVGEALRTVKDLQEEVGSLPDPLDRAVQEEDFALKLKARERDLKLISKIEEAIQRIESNEYGYCEICGTEIGIPRLEVRPTATQCIECKTLEELKEKHNDF